MTVNKQNAKDIYRYFKKALNEKRLFKEESDVSLKAQEKFLDITSTHDDMDTALNFIQFLQKWITEFVSEDKWQRCLATLRQTRSNQLNSVKSIKLNKTTYDVLKQYSDSLGLSLPDSILHALNTIKIQSPTILPRIKGSFQTPINDNNQEMLLGMRLTLENNSKFVRGKKKIREEILYFLEEYKVRRYEGHAYDYILTVSYDNDEELDSIIEYIYTEIASRANWRSCYLEINISSLDGQKRW